MNYNCQLWRDSEEGRTGFVRRNECLQISRKSHTAAPEMPDIGKGVNDKFGCVRMPPCHARIKTDSVVMIWVFVQVVDPVADSVHKKEGAAQAEKYDEVDSVEYASFQDVCRSILVVPLSSGLKVDFRSDLVGKSY